jgi:hypothetical protein
MRLLMVVAPGLCTSLSAAQTTPHRGVVLADLTWIEAEAVLKPDAVVVIPLGAGSKEHGPHLRLDNDLRMAQYLADRVVAAADVVAAPAIPYHYYPAFLEYPGSTSTSFETARDLVVEIAHSLATYGPHRFYVLNTGYPPCAPGGRRTGAAKGWHPPAVHRYRSGERGGDEARAAAGAGLARRRDRNLDDALHRSRASGHETRGS